MYEAIGAKPALTGNMTKSELSRLRKALENMRSELTSAAGKRETLAINTSPEELDRIQDAGDRDWAMRGLERNSNRLKDVRDALGRVDAGTYGVCDGCEEDIGLKRLAAVPWTSSCIACQEAADCETALIMAA
jgi:DnaK suppressor protein